MTERNRKLVLKAHRTLRKITHCAYCGRKGTELSDPDGKSWNIDHIRPLALGGADALWNMTKCCSACNADKGAEHWRVLTRGVVTAAKVKAAMDGRGRVAGMRRTVPVPKTAKEVARIKSTANARWRSREAGWDREFQLKERREARCAPQG